MIMKTVTPVAALESFMAKKEALEEKYDNASDAWQESERGEHAQEAISCYEDVISALEALLECTGNA